MNTVPLPSHWKLRSESFAYIPVTPLSSMNF